jgi:hypothetical protein
MQPDLNPPIRQSLSPYSPAKHSPAFALVQIPGQFRF